MNFMDYKELYMEYITNNFSHNNTIYYRDTETICQLIMDIEFTHESNTSININNIIKRIFELYMNEGKIFWSEYSLKQMRY